MKWNCSKCFNPLTCSTLPWKIHCSFWLETSFHHADNESMHTDAFHCREQLLHYKCIKFDRIRSKGKNLHKGFSKDSTRWTFNLAQFGTTLSQKGYFPLPLETGCKIWSRHISRVCWRLELMGIKTSSTSELWVQCKDNNNIRLQILQITTSITKCRINTLSKCLYVWIWHGMFAIVWFSTSLIF